MTNRHRMKRFIALGIIWWAAAGWTLSQETLTVGQVIDLIKQEVTCPWATETVDKLKSGHPDQQVTGIATTFMATMGVLQQAEAMGLNMIITHEPTFYNHFDDRKPLARDPVQQGKIKYLDDHGLAVWRFHDHWHRTQPDGINHGMVDAFGWRDYQVGNQMIFDIPKTTLQELSAYVTDHFQTSTVRNVGDPLMEVERVGMVLGAAGSAAHMLMLNQLGVQVLIVGESREWETVEYVRDARTLGMDKALIIMGHADSEEEGMAYCAEWLRGFITQVPVKHIPAKNPLWRAH